MENRKTKTEPQIYGKNHGIQSGWVNIQVPAEIARSLQQVDLSIERNCSHLRMILNEDVFDALYELISSPHLSKNNFDDVLFSFLGMGALSNNMFYDEKTNDFFYAIQYLLTRCMAQNDVEIERLRERSMKNE